MINKNGQIIKTPEYSKMKLVKRGVIFCFSLLLLAIMGVTHFDLINSRTYSNYRITRAINITNTNTSQYLNYHTGIIKYSTDGAVAIDKNGKLLWNGSYEITDPIIDTCGNYAVIAEKDGHDIHIYDEDGEAGNITTIYDIIKVEIASQGVITVLMEADDANYILMYDVDGTVIYDMKTNVNTDGVPLDMSLSNDGTKLVTSYLSFTTGSLIDHISFYNFDEVGQNEVNKLVGGWPLDESIFAPRVEFTNEDTVCIYKDNGFTLCSMKEIPRVIKNVDFEGEINSILSNDKYIGFVLQESGDNSEHLMIFDLEGNKVIDKPLEFDYDTICFSNNDIIIYNERTCLILNQYGNIKFNYIFDSDIKAFYQSTQHDLYYYVNDDKLNVIQLIK